ncbi:MAG: hypothetical protein GY853_01695 [PVC group bacterium]|nr:hypothetical protein [PVC group bacterium]
MDVQAEKLTRKCELQTCKGTMTGVRYKKGVLWKCDVCTARLFDPEESEDGENNE